MTLLTACKIGFGIAIIIGIVELVFLIQMLIEAWR
jgi:hypothetical protein